MSPGSHRAQASSHHYRRHSCQSDCCPEKCVGPLAVGLLLQGIVGPGDEKPKSAPFDRTAPDLAFSKGGQLSFKSLIHAQP